MTDYGLNSAVDRLAAATTEVAYAIRDSAKRREPIFIFLPSDIDHPKVKELGKMLSDAFRERL